MTTTYYTFRTRKVKVSGGPDLVTLVPEVQTAPAPRSAGEAKGEVLDFDFCRKHMETKNAWKDLVETAEQTAGAEDTVEEMASAPRTVRKQAPVWLDVAASLAVIATALAATAAFLGLV